jgi:diguanylate cyclase (GGDEF)-like protein
MAALMLEKLHANNQEFILSYTLLNRHGKVVLDTNESNIGNTHTDRAYYQQPMQTGLPYVSPVVFSMSTDEPSFYLGSPVQNMSGEVIGVLCVRYSASVLQYLVDQADIAIPEQSFIILLDENHVRLAHSAADELLYRAALPLHTQQIIELQASRRLPTRPNSDVYVPEEGLSSVIAQSRLTTRLTAIESENHMLALARLETQPWRVVLVQPREVFLAPMRAQTHTTLLLSLAIASSVIASAIVMGRLLAEPIERLTAVSEQVASGDLTVRVPTDARGEIGRLARTFNSMADQLYALVGGLEQQVAERTADLRQANEQLRQEIIERQHIEEQLLINQQHLLNNQQELHRLATTDWLTGLYNRRYFFELAEREVRLAERSEAPVAVIMLDIDHFKRVNDTYGHTCGDQVLNMVAQRCQAALRSTDIMSRYGGEEFVILLPHTDIDAASNVAERLRLNVANEPVQTDNGTLTGVTISVGITSAEGTVLNLDDLLEEADTALFTAKRTGRNRVCIADHQHALAGMGLAADY